jgi:NTE family protein
MPDGTRADVRIVPDEGALRAFGDNVGDMSRGSPVYREGRRQAADAAKVIAAAPPG